MKPAQPGVWIILIVGLLTIVRGARLIYRSHGGHRGEVATALGSINTIYGTPRSDALGSKVLYLQSSQAGIGLFSADVGSGKKQLLHEKSVMGYIDCVSPFSPDDALFALVTDSIYDSGYLSICLADSMQELARIQAPQWHVFEIAWLTPEKLVCWGRPGNGAPFHFIQKQPDGAWKTWTSDILATNASCLTSLSSNAFAWLDANGLCVMNTTSNSVTTVFKTDKRKVGDFSFSPETGEFLVTCRENDLYSLWRFKPGKNTPDEIGQLASDKHIYNARWINGNKGYAYLDQKTLVLKADAGSQSLRLPNIAAEKIMVAEDGHRLFFTGTVTNEPWEGLWSYDIAKETLANVVPYSDHLSTQVFRTDPVLCGVHTSSNRWLYYYVYWPANFDRHKKYPMLMGDTPFLTLNALYQKSAHGPNWAEAIASCGAYVVIVDRNSWFGDLANWDKDVMDIYHRLIPDPTIDTSRVFLFSASAETRPMSTLVEEKPELWKGAMFLNPTILPKLSKLDPNRRLPKIFLSAGEEEKESKRFKEFQQEAFGRGINVEVQEISKTGHYLISTSAVRARTIGMTRFVFE
ncbi:MAG TPA: hypothetical protein VFC07_02135 [Verrucomicrobiae bacterium]|nr:hypothetical protein [Verrucomicrobiae bacterium]